MVTAKFKGAEVTAYPLFLRLIGRMLLRNESPSPFNQIAEWVESRLAEPDPGEIGERLMEKSTAAGLRIQSIDRIVIITRLEGGQRRTYTVNKNRAGPWLEGYLAGVQTVGTPK